MYRFRVAFDSHWSNHGPRAMTLNLQRAGGRIESRIRITARRSLAGGVSEWQDRQKKCEIQISASLATTDLALFPVPIGKDASNTFICSDIFTNSDSDGGDILVYDNCDDATCAGDNNYEQ